MEGMKFNAHIGCYPGEQVLGNEIAVSVEVTVSSLQVESMDDIHSTINYEDLYVLVSDVLKERMNLLETAVKKIMDQISIQFPSVEKIKVRVAKPNPPIHGIVNKVWVEDEWVR